jgi:hypothetical protein
MLGLAVPADGASGLEPRGSQSWSERLTARLALDHPRSVDTTVRDLLRRAWDGA